MAVLRKKEIKNMALEELEKKLAQLQEEVAREKGTIATHGKPTNSGRFREMKKVVARILTILKDKRKKTK